MEINKDSNNRNDNIIGCWHSWPCEYDDFKREPNDNYVGDIFGYLSDFDSPHWLFRRFHKNYCKSLILTKLENYKLIDEKSEPSDLLLSQISEINNTYFSVEQLSRHNSLVLMIGAIETFLKDCFIILLKYVFPEKIGKSTAKNIVRKYSFQNIESINRGYKWLINDFKSENIYIMRNPIDSFKNLDITEELNRILDIRHKIVHESFYSDDLDSGRFSFYAFICFQWAVNFNYYFTDNGYYNKIDLRYNRIFNKEKSVLKSKNK